MDYHQSDAQHWSNPFPANALSTSTDSGDRAASEARASPTEQDIWTADMDRKTKKRIQNRVAQRTYRSRIRQRLQDLQRELYEMRTGRQLGEHCSQPAESNDIGHTSVDPAGHGASNAFDMFPELWAGMPGDLLWNSTDQRQAVPALPPSPMSAPDTVPAVTSLQAASPTAVTSRLRSNIGSEDAGSFPSQNNACGDHGAFTALSAPRALSRSWTCVNGPSPVASAKLPAAAHAGPVLRPRKDEGSDLSSPQNNPATRSSDTTPAHSAPPTDAAATPATDFSEDAAKIPDPGAPVEDRFSYVLECARRVGFDWDFDALAAQYYAHDFEAGSDLALEQRLSRSRRLPDLLAQLRQSSSAWSRWQRRGYEDEMLRAAEEICARECSDFYAKKRQLGGEKRDRQEEEEEADDEGPGAVMLEDRLPNLWALLRGLAASNPLLQHSKRTSVASLCMQLLCGEAPATFRQGTA